MLTNEDFFKMFYQMSLRAVDLEDMQGMIKMMLNKEDAIAIEKQAKSHKKNFVDDKN